jgi:chemotaxis protein CheC
VSTYTDLQLDALRELANIGSGTAATALSGMLGRPIDISVPNPVVLPIPEAVEAAGPADEERTAVAIPIFGDLDAVVLLLFDDEAASSLCGLLGIDPADEMAISMLSEIGNILGASYVGAIGQMTGLHLEPAPPQPARDMLASIMSTVLLMPGADTENAMLLDTDLTVEDLDTACSPSFLFIPSKGGVGEMLARLGLES